jgi:hypothetical protein
MDYIETFRKYCNSHLNRKIVRLPNAATNQHQKYLFERELRDTKYKLENELEQIAEKCIDLAIKNGVQDVSNFWPDMKNTIRTLLRDWQEIQEDNSGLYD